MNTLLAIDNLFSWSAEVAIIVIAAAGAAAAALRDARARLYFWQAILATALLLPAAALWNRSTVVPMEFELRAVPAGAIAPAAALRPSAVLRIEPVLAVLALGAILRLLWIAAGFFRLMRIRRNARPLEQPPLAFSGGIRWYESDQISGPVTFGWLRPAILLPSPVMSLTAGVQEAIARHELCHVQRRDWLFVMGEELIRSVLWFHPAVWFVLSQIQLAREQVVDREVVRTTRDRAGYLEALMSVAAHKLHADVAPAPLFLKKRQLAVRVAAIVKENSMSAFRLAAHAAGAASFVVLGLCAALWFFPMRSSAQVAPDDSGITVDAGAALAHRAPVRYPQGSIARGDVLVEISLNAKGEVADARVLSGPEELRKAALASVLEWHYLADTAPPALVHATIHFGPRAAATAVAAAPPPLPPPPPAPPAALGGRGGRGALPTPPPPRPPPPPPESAVVQQIQFRGMSPELQQRVQNGLTVREGDTLGSAAMAQLRDELQRIDEHIVVNQTYDPQRANVTLWITLQPAVATAAPGALPALPPGVYRIGAGVSAPVPISRADPEYSEEARVAKWQGAVLLQVVINEEGVPQDIKVIRPLGLGLDQKAIEAVQKWRFKPSLLNGKPVPVAANMEINFRLLQSPQ